MPQLLTLHLPTPISVLPCPPADVTLSTTQSRVNPAHPRDLNGHHGITITEAQANLVQRCDRKHKLIKH
jgi:hypothetical protein